MIYYIIFPLTEEPTLSSMNDMFSKALRHHTLVGQSPTNFIDNPICFIAAQTEEAIGRLKTTERDMIRLCLTYDYVGGRYNLRTEIEFDQIARTYRIFEALRKLPAKLDNTIIYV